MRGIDDYFGAAGDMFSGSQDPVEQNRALEKEAEKQRREQQREQERLLREQQAAQAGLQNPLQQTVSKPVVIENNEPAPLPKIDPDDPLSGVPDAKRTDILLRKYDDPVRKPTDLLGQPLSGDRRDEYVDSWKNRVIEASPDVRDTLLQLNIHRDPAIRQQVEQVRRDFQQWRPKPELKTLELRLDDIDPQSIALRTLEYRPQRDGVVSAQKVIQYVNEPVTIIKANNSLLSQAASVNNPQDESMTPWYREFLGAFSSAFGNDKAVTGYGRHQVGHSDPGYGEAEKKAGRAIAGYVNKGLARSMAKTETGR